MKTTHRSIPNDILSVEEGRHRITISTHRSQIIVSVWKDETHSRQEWYSFTEFRNAIESIMDPEPLSPPSEPDKEATAPSVDTKQAAPEFASHAVGDRVEFRVPAYGFITGIIAHIDAADLATVRSVNGGIYHKHLCALKNLSREEKA